MLDQELSQQLQDLINLVSLRTFLLQARDDRTLTPRVDRRENPELAAEWQEKRKALDSNVEAINALVMTASHELLLKFRNAPSTAKIVENEVIDMEEIKKQKKAEREARKLQMPQQPRDLKAIKKNKREVEEDE